MCYPNSRGRSLYPDEWQRADRTQQSQAVTDPQRVSEQLGNPYEMSQRALGFGTSHQLPEIISFLAKVIFSLAFSKHLILPYLSLHLSSENPRSPECSRRQQFLSDPSGLCSPLRPTYLCGWQNLMYLLSDPLWKKFVNLWTKVPTSLLLGLVRSGGCVHQNTLLASCLPLALHPLRK